MGPLNSPNIVEGYYKNILFISFKMPRWANSNWTFAISLCLVAEDTPVDMYSITLPVLQFIWCRQEGTGIHWWMWKTVLKCQFDSMSATHTIFPPRGRWKLNYLLCQGQWTDLFDLFFTKWKQKIKCNWLLNQTWQWTIFPSVTLTLIDSLRPL